MATREDFELSGVIAAGGVLDRIVEAKARRVSRAKEERQAALDNRSGDESGFAASREPTPQPFFEALSARNSINVIAEIKRRSPSKGIIREDFDPVSIAESYAQAGAAVLSVLTEEDFFGGSLDYLRAIRARVDLPLLRKDFIFDEFQVHESVEAGADAILLIVAILSDPLLKRLINLADELGIATLVEAHTEQEMKRALAAGAKIVGVNNRNLITFDVDLETSIRLAPLAPDDAILVAESGISNEWHIRRLASAGFRAFLIGEHFMREADPGEALSRLIAEARRPVE